MKAYTILRRNKKRQTLADRLLSAALWLILWQVAYYAVGEDLLLVSPLTAFGRLVELSLHAGFWLTISHSLGRILLGFLLGLLFGALLAACTSRWAPAYHFVALPMGVIKAAPVASFVILALLWIGKGSLSLFIAFLMVLPLAWSNLHEGFSCTDPQLLEMAKVYRLPYSKIFRYILLPSAMPYFLSAARVGLGFAWKAGVAGEVIAIPAHAIGRQLYDAKIYLETADLFAWTAVTILLSILLEKLLVAGIKLCSKRLNRFTGQREEVSA